MIEAYCARRSYAGGDDIELHISSDIAHIDLRIMREGRRPAIVYEQRGIAARRHDVPLDVVENGCDWPIGFSLRAQTDWASGFYRIVLTAANGDCGEAFFVLRARSPASSMLWVVETNTWNAYNFYGGKSTYTTDGNGYSRGAPRVSFLRPLPKGFLPLPSDAPLIGTLGPADQPLPYARWAARHGVSAWTGAASWGQWGTRFADWLDGESIAVDYAVNADLEGFPHILDDYKLMLSVGHEEYWSWDMRDTVEGFIARGGNAAFLGGSCCYWQMRLEKDLTQMVA